MNATAIRKSQVLQSIDQQIFFGKINLVKKIDFLKKFTNGVFFVWYAWPFMKGLYKNGYSTMRYGFLKAGRFNFRDIPNHFSITSYINIQLILSFLAFIDVTIPSSWSIFLLIKLCLSVYPLKRTSNLWCFIYYVSSIRAQIILLLQVGASYSIKPISIDVVFWCYFIITTKPSEFFSNFDHLFWPNSLCLTATIQ